MLFKLTNCDQAREESGDRAELENKVALVDTMVDSFIKVHQIFIYSVVQLNGNSYCG